MKANDRQVGGNHYRTGRKGIQHWDLAAAQDYDYFQGQITKYVDRWKKKNGIADLEKALHFLQKYIEEEKAKLKEEKYKLEDKAYNEEIQNTNPDYPNNSLPGVKIGMYSPFGYDVSTDS